jgi:GNAT superfamily N-acetyltransferase
MTAPPGEIRIRPYQPPDRDAVRKIAYETSFLERPGSFVRDQGLVADLLTYYADYEPESCFVAVRGSGIAGYIMGTKDSRKMERIFYRRILPCLMFKAFMRGLFFQPAFLRFFWNFLKGFLKGEFRIPDYSREYPALLHINLDRNYRDAGVGSRLIRHFEQYLQGGRVKGVHLGTMSERARGFFLKNAYQVLRQSRRSYLRYRLGEDVCFYILGKRL